MVIVDLFLIIIVNVTPKIVHILLETINRRTINKTHWQII